MGIRKRRFGAVAVALSLLVSACGGGGTAAPRTGEVDRSAELRVGINVPALPIDPHKGGSDVAQFTYASLVYDRLTKIDPGLELEPMLATSWTFAEDGLSIDFRLREGVTFSDGAALDAAAVKASLDRAAFDPESTVAHRFVSMESVEVTGPLAVRIHTKRKAAELPYLLAGTAASIVSPKALGNADLDVRPVGSGPYELTELKLGELAVFQRRDGYWNPEDGRAKTLRLLAMTDDNARLNALRSGQIDLAFDHVGMAAKADALGEGFKTFAYPPGSSFALFLNGSKPPLDDVKVRQALNYAIDREAINKSLLGGYCKTNVQPLPEGVPGHLATPPVDYAYDPAKAKALLAEAGHADGFSIDLLFGSGLSPESSIATALQAQLAEVGVKVTIDPQDISQIAALYTKNGYDSYLQYRLANATPIVTLSSNYLSPRLYPGKVPAEFAESLEAASDPNATEADVTASLEKASAVANSEAFDLYLCQPPTMMMFSDAVVGADEMGASYYTGTFDLRKVGLLG
ncbi:peptide/nickel transport system substrate-binding protein [Actinocorallia herbida]|uniref:Peptide/nickel transport system substrate-binding protein n=1 Tax=Actinocorallia herbida TaxID=58109 RepID=A0A3N1D1P8_9ACTN|nr:ABC transporter substrate-binding protein [Actinocorallia herbida]ROO87453.1 peptide/nickel transport system substrate-binding protein [Actinocorallia herbida]